MTSELAIRKKSLFTETHPHGVPQVPEVNLEQPVSSPRGSPRHPFAGEEAVDGSNGRWNVNTGSSSFGEDERRNSIAAASPRRRKSGSPNGGAPVLYYDEERRDSGSNFGALSPSTESARVCLDDFDWGGLSPKSEWLKVGKGGYGTVYKAKWYGETVAIKEASRTKSNAKSSLRKEVSYLMRCTHPNLVRVYGCYEDGDSFYVVMEYLPYCFRDEWVVGRVDVLQVTIQVARAMLYLHRKGIIHRDIKTRNICLTADYKVAKVLDFGLAASLFSSSDELMRRVGTRKYRAPEVNHPNIQGFAVDVYSFGAMLKRLLNDMASNVIECKNASSLNVVLGPLAGMCLNSNPCVRPTSLEILQYLHQCNHMVMPVKEIFATTMNEDLKENALGLDSTYDPLGKHVIGNGEEEAEGVSHNGEADETGLSKRSSASTGSRLTRKSTISS